MIDKKMMKRIWVSKGGAAIMFSAYSLTVLGLSLFGVNYYELSEALKFILVPGAFLVSFTPDTATSLLGVPFLTLLVSLVIYTTIGFVADFIYKPKK